MTMRLSKGIIAHVNKKNTMRDFWMVKDLTFETNISREGRPNNRIKGYFLNLIITAFNCDGVNVNEKGD
jgi:hypothetical protein